MIKRILQLCLLLTSINSQADSIFSAIPCTLNGDLITNTIGYSADDNLCDFRATELKLDVYKIALCTQGPAFSNLTQPDFSSCSFIYNSETSSEIAVNANSSFNLDKLTKPAPGIYPHILLITSNNVKIKAQAHFDSTRFAENGGGGSGTYCWTDGSVVHKNPDSVTGNGLSCGNSVNSASYNFNEIAWAGSVEGTEEVPGGVAKMSMLTSNLLLTGVVADTARLGFLYTLNTPIAIASNTYALKMSINIGTGASLVFDQPTQKIKWIEDAPFAYIIEPVNQSNF